MHASKAILSDLQKLDQVHRAEIKRVAGLDTDSATPDGANCGPPVVDMSRKISAHSAPGIHDTTAPSTSRPKAPPANWPSNPIRTSSGLARPGRIGSMPSKVGPSR
jgi:hypothetical protein